MKDPLWKRLLVKGVHDVAVFITPDKMMAKLMSCEQICKYISEAEELPKSQSFFFKLHLAICQSCADFDKENVFLKHNLAKALSPDNKTLSAADHDFQNDLISKFSNTKEL